MTPPPDLPLQPSGNRSDCEAPAIFDSADRKELMARLLGEQVGAPILGPYRNPIVRHVVIYWLPWPPGKVQGPPEGFTTAPTRWASDLAALEERVERYGPARSWPDHPMFGHMSGRDWGVFCYRHFDHHLRQFDA
jgi:hypothetical protein